MTASTLPLQLSRRQLLSGAAAASAAVLLHPFSVQAQGNEAHLRIMATTDLHVHVYPYDYYGDRENVTMGLSRTAAIMDQIRAEATNAILIDNGDFLQGNPMGDYIAYERGMNDGDVHPIVKAMNVLNYDAATLGNHEFNYGLDFMFKVLEGADFPVVSANLTKGELAEDPADDDLHLPPYVIIDRELTDGAGQTHPIRIGIIGFLPPQIMTWDQRHLEGRANARDIIAAARAFVPRMREEGAEIVIALAHSGIAEAEHTEGMENAAVPLAAIDGIDAIVSGHLHLVFPGPDFEEAGGDVDHEAGTIAGKPAVMAGFWGSHLGLIDLMLTRENDSWRITDQTVEARPIFQRPEEGSPEALVEDKAEVLEAAATEHEETLAYVRTPVGTTSAPLHSYFALVADDPSVQIVSQAQSWYVRQMMQGTEHADLPVLSAAAPFKSGGRGGPDYYTEVPAGDIAIRNVADLYLYPNTIQAVVITGAQVKNWLERSAGIFNRIEPGAEDAALINPGFPSYNFDVIDGVTYKIDLSQPSRYDSEGVEVDPQASRIVDLMHEGGPIDPEARFVVATNNYRAGGGGAFPEIGADKVVFVGPDTNRDIIVRYIVEQGEINPSADANWTFAAMEGTSAVFETGPRAANFISDVKGVTIEEAGDGADGFAKFRVML